MPSRNPLWLVPVALLSLAVVGCDTNVTVDDTDPEPDPETGCLGERPDVPNDAWCPPVYECIGGEWVEVAGDCAEPECPAAKPQDGGPCEMVGQACTYEEAVPCGELGQVEVLCTSDGWLATYNYCQPEPECPDQLPVVGADCTGWDNAFGCQYSLDLACGEKFVFVDCSYTEGGQQAWTTPGSLTCEICNDNDTEAECALSPECQWLNPGCGDEPIQTGCYPKVGCDVAGCTDDSVCLETTYDPCYGQACDACGASYFACLPSWAP